MSRLVNSSEVVSGTRARGRGVATRSYWRSVEPCVGVLPSTVPCLPERFPPKPTFRLASLVLAAGFLGGCSTSFRLPSLYGGDLASIAERDDGKNARQMGVPATLWCAAAIEVWRGRAGLSRAGSHRAIDQARAGRRISRPERGALMITRRGTGHHVDVVTAVHDDGTVSVIGGNVGGIVARRIVPARGIFIMPS